MTNVATTAEINVLINTAAATTQLRSLQKQITSLAVSEKAADARVASALAGNNAKLRQNIDLSGKFRSNIIPMSHSVDQFSKALDKSNLSLNQYARGVASQMPLMRKTFKREFDMMSAIATDRVKKLQTQYTAMGNAKAMAFTPTALENSMAARTAITAQKQMLLNKMISDGSTKLVNWGKNTQWAGRQLMVGLTLPLTLFGAVASKVFMDLDRQARDFKRVYGDAFTPPAEINQNLEAIKALGMEYTKYGVKVQETLEVGATAAAAGMRNKQLLSGTEQTLRLSTIGQIDYQQALKTTISLQNAFKVSNEQLAPTVDYIGAVANQTVLTVDDMTKAIPRVAPVIAGLGGDIKDLSVFLVAMREGGVSAEQGANALKSGLANLINPTKGAIEATSKLGINIKGIVNANRGDLMGTIKAFGQALAGVSKFERQQVLEKVFGKYQYARLGALFDNITKKSKQTAVAMDLMGKSSSDLAELSAKSLREIEQSTTAKFESAIERLKVAIAPVGEAFLKALTPVIGLVTKLAEKFNDLPDTVKSVAGYVVAGLAIIGPVIMTAGLIFGNLIGNMIKGVQTFRKGLAFLSGDSSKFKFMTSAELEAAAAAQSLEGSTTRLTDKLLMQKNAVSLLSGEYFKLTEAMAAATAVAFPGGAMGVMGKVGKVGKHAKGIVKVPGSGSGDIYPAMLEPGESVVTKGATQKYAPVLSAMNAGTLPGFYEGIVDLDGKQIKGALVMAHGGDGHILNDDKMGKIQAENAARPGGGNKAISSATKMNGLSNFVFPTPDEFNRGKMSGNESAKLFDPKNKAVFERTMHGVYNAVAQQLGTDVKSAFQNNSGLKRELDAMGANIGKELKTHGTAAIKDPQFYSAIDKAIKGTTLSPETQKAISDARAKTTTTRVGRKSTPAEYASTGNYMKYERIPMSEGTQNALFPKQGYIPSYKSWWGKKNAAGKLAGRMFPFGRQLGEAYNNGANSRMGNASPSILAQQATEQYTEGVKVGTAANVPEASKAGSLLGAAYAKGAASKISKVAGMSDIEQAKAALAANGSGGALQRAMAAENARQSSMTERQRLAESYRYRIDSGIDRIGDAARGAVSGARAGAGAIGRGARAGYNASSAMTAKLDMRANDLFKAATKTKQGLVTAGQAISDGATKLRWGIHDATAMAAKVPATLGVGVTGRSPSMALEAMGLGRKVDSAAMAWNSALTKAEVLGATVKSTLASAATSVKGAGLLAKDVGQALSNRDPRSALKMVGVDAAAINAAVQAKITSGGEKVANGIVAGGEKVMAGFARAGEELKAAPAKIRTGAAALAEALKNSAANIAASAALLPGQIARGAKEGAIRTGGLLGRLRRRGGEKMDANGYPAALGYGDQAEKQPRRFGQMGKGFNTATMGLMGLSMAGSFAEGALGELSQKVMMVSMGMMGLQMVLPLVSNPLGAVALGATAVAGGLWMLNNSAHDAQADMINYSIAAQGSAKAFNEFASEMGGIKPTDAFNAVLAGVRTKEDAARLTDGQSFLESDGGKAMLERSKMLAGGARKSALSTELMQSLSLGIITPDQATGVAQALALALKDPTLGSSLVAGISSYVRTNGSDIGGSIKFLMDGITKDIGSTVAQQQAATIDRGAYNDLLTKRAKSGVMNYDTGEAGPSLTKEEMQAIIDFETQGTAGYENLTKAIGPLLNASTKLAEVQAFLNLQYRKGNIDLADYQKGTQDAQQQTSLLNKSFTDLWASMGKDANPDDKLRQAAEALGTTGEDLDKVFTQANAITEQLTKMGYGNAAAVGNAAKIGLLSGRMSVGEAGSIPGLMENKEYRATLDLAISTGDPNKLAQTVSLLNQVDQMPPEVKKKILLDVKDANGFSGLFGDNSAMERAMQEAVTHATYFAGNPTLSRDTLYGLQDRTMTTKQASKLEKTYGNANKAMNGKVQIAGIEQLKEVDKWLTKIGKSKNIKNTIDVGGNWRQAFNAFGLTYARFSRLSNIKKALIMVNVEAFYTLQEQFKSSEALLASNDHLNQMMGKAQQEGITTSTEGLKNDTQDIFKGDGKALPRVNPAADEGGGGGGGDKADPVGDLGKSLNEKLKLYTNVNTLLGKLKGKQKDFLSIVKKLGVKDSLVADMRKAGLNEVLIAEIIGKGYADAKKIWDKYSDGKGGLSDAGKDMNKRSIFGNAAEQIEALKAQRTTSNNRVSVARRMQGTGLTRDQITEALSDDTAVNTLAGLKNSDKMWKIYINSIKQAAKAAEAARDPLEKVTEIFEQAKGVIDKAFDSEELRLRNEANATFLAQTGTTVALMEREVQKNDRLIQQAQNLIDLKQETIDDLQHANDLIQNGIDDLSRQTDIRERSADAMSHDLEMLSKQEEAIRKAYQDRIDALQKVQDINADIVAQQQAQLNLSQALSQGDIYAATAAAAAQRAQAAQSASGRSMGALNEAMTNAVGGLRTQGGLTREQAEAQVANIKEQSYQSSLKIRAEEDKIYANNLLVRDLTEQIYQINENTIEPLEFKNKTMQQTLELQSEGLDWAIKSALVADITREQWDLKVQAMQLAIDKAAPLDTSLASIRDRYNEIATAAERAANAAHMIGGGGGLWNPAATLPSGMSNAQAMTLGIIPTRRAGGGLVPGTGGMDSTLVKATPKEFVVRKAMVDKYGIPMLNAINQGSYDMPTYATGSTPVGLSSQVTQNLATNISAPVYNQVTVIVPDSDASPDAIANKVVTRLTGLGNTSIRTLRGING